MGKSKKKPEVISEQVVEEAKNPGFLDYLKAVWQLATAWVKRHKFISIFLLVMILVFGSWLVINKISDASELTNDEIVVSVSKQLGISGDANPAILDVVDDQKVSQPFLQDAQNGDVVLLYYKANKSVLYRPSSEEIVREGVFTPPDPKVFVRDASGDDKLLEDVLEALEDMDGLKISSQDKSVNQYDKILIISVTDRYEGRAEAIAKELNGEVVRLPKGESVPDADVLVIVGN